MSERTNSPRRQAQAATSWHDAVRSGDVNRVRKALDEGTDINALDEHGQTALMNAVYWGNNDIAKLLIERGAELNHTAKFRLTALYLAVIGKRTELVQALVDAGADTTLQGSAGDFDRTPLEYAQQKGVESVVQILRKST